MRFENVKLSTKNKESSETFSADQYSNRVAHVPLALALYDADEQCRAALKKGLEGTGMVSVLHEGDHGQHVIDACQRQCPDVVWLDNNLHGDVITFDIALYLRELNPKMPIIIFTGCDYCASMQNVPDSRLMTHYGLLSKNTYRLPEQLVETIREVNAGRIIIDPDIAHWQHKVNKHKRNSPLLLLSSIEQEVIARLAQGMTNKEIANDLGLKDERTVSRINGSIYTAWGVPAVGAFEKVARTRATLIYLNDSLITWDACGKPELPEQHSKHRHKNYKNF